MANNRRFIFHTCTSCKYSKSYASISIQLSTLSDPYKYKATTKPHLVTFCPLQCHYTDTDHYDPDFGKPAGSIIPGCYDKLAC